MLVCSDRNFNETKHIIQAIETFEYEISEVIFMSNPKDDSGNDHIQKTAKEWAVKNKIKAVPFKIDWKNIKVPNADVQTNKFGKYNKNAAIHCKEQMMDYCDGVISIDDSYEVKKAKEADKYVHVYKIRDNKDESEYEHYFWG